MRRGSVPCGDHGPVQHPQPQPPWPGFCCRAGRRQGPGRGDGGVPRPQPAGSCVHACLLILPHCLDPLPPTPRSKAQLYLPAGQQGGLQSGPSLGWSCKEGTLPSGTFSSPAFTSPLPSHPFRLLTASSQAGTDTGGRGRGARTRCEEKAGNRSPGIIVSPGHACHHRVTGSVFLRCLPRPHSQRPGAGARAGRAARSACASQRCPAPAVCGGVAAVRWEGRQPLGLRLQGSGTTGTSAPRAGGPGGGRTQPRPVWAPSSGPRSQDGSCGSRRGQNQQAVAVPEGEGKGTDAPGQEPVEGGLGGLTLELGPVECPVH